MKRLTCLAVGVLVFSFGLSAVQAQTTYYFDQNDTAPDSGVMSQKYTWSTDGSTISGAPAATWNTDAGGVGSTSPLPFWTNGSNAVFSAGTDATGVFYGVNIAAGVNSGSIEIQEGILQDSSGTIDTTAAGGTNTITVDAGAALQTIASGQFTGGGKVTLIGTSTTDAGEIQARNPGSAGSTLNSGSTAYKTVEINGFGRISYDNATILTDVPDDAVSILSSNAITGVGGTPTNGGAGTLIKSGKDQLGIAVKDIGGAVGNFTLFSFAKLRVEQGGYRLRNGTVGTTTGVIDERLFGAVPLTPLADAITLDGGGIGSNATVTLNANRGITILNSANNALGVLANDSTLGGGYFDSGAGAGLTIPSQISGSGNLYIGDPTSTAASAPTFTLSNANNVNSFTGGLIGVRGTLLLNSSLKVDGLKDVAGFSQNPTNNAVITIASGQTLTSGVNGGGGTWSKAIGGAGGYTKMGSGTETLTAVNTYGGNTTVQGGTLSISNPYLADAADVLLSTGSFFNLNFAGTDTIRSLYIDGVGQATGTWGGTGSGATHISSLITGTGLLNVTTAVIVGLPGDFNNDGKVDAADYNVWRKNTANVALQNDNGVGTQAARYSLWRSNFGNGPGAGSGGGLSAGAVPEPAAIGLVLMGLASLGLVRRGR